MFCTKFFTFPQRAGALPAKTSDFLRFFVPGNLHISEIAKNNGLFSVILTASCRCALFAQA